MLGLVQICGGLALFLFGIRILSSGMEKLAGEQIQKWLDRVTGSRLKSAAFGVVATALIQSSGLLMVTMIGLINANVMSVEQAIGVMLGQEIGTTITAQIVAFDIGRYRLALVIAGVFFTEFMGRERRKYGEILMGLGIIFIGMGYMAQSLEVLVTIPWVCNGLVMMGQHPMLGLMAGVIVTSLTQSSTAVTSMTVAMGMSNAISLHGAVGMILGANIGSCITGLIASLHLSRTARRASVAQIAINVFGVLLFAPFIGQYADLVSHTSTDLPRQIANAHTIFNVAVSCILFPFVRRIARFSELLVPPREASEKPKVTAFIDELQYSVPAVALNEAARELVRLGQITADMLELGCRALVEGRADLAEAVVTQEREAADPITRKLDEFVSSLMQEDLSTTQRHRCLQLRSLLADIERVGDIAEGIAERALERVRNDVAFSDQAMQKVAALAGHAHGTYALSLQAFQKKDRELAHQVCRLESEFDGMYWKTREEHITRLTEGLCQPEADVIFTETLRSLERASDHAENLAASVLRS